MNLSHLVNAPAHAIRQSRARPKKAPLGRPVTHTHTLPSTPPGSLSGARVSTCGRGCAVNYRVGVCMRPVCALVCVRGVIAWVSGCACVYVGAVIVPAPWAHIGRVWDNLRVTIAWVCGGVCTCVCRGVWVYVRPIVTPAKYRAHIGRPWGCVWARYVCGRYVPSCVRRVWLRGRICPGV